MKTRNYLLLDYDLVLSGTSAGETFWVPTTLEKARARGKTDDIVIFTSMDERTMRQDAGDILLLNPDEKKKAVTRENGVALLQEIYNENGRKEDQVRVLTPEDAFRQVPIGHTYEQTYKGFYELYKRAYSPEGRIDQEILKEGNYFQLKLDELYSRVTDSLFQTFLKGEERMIPMDKSSIRPWAQEINSLVTLLSLEDKDLEGEILEKINGLMNATEIEDIKEKINELNEVITPLEQPKLNDVLTLMSLLAENSIAPQDNAEEKIKKFNELKKAYSEFLDDRQEEAYIKPARELFDLVKDERVDFEPEKFLMSLHFLREMAKEAEAGETINIEYCDDKESNLQSMIAAHRLFMEKFNDKNLKINLTTILVEPKEDYAHKPYNSEAKKLADLIEQMEKDYKDLGRSTHKKDIRRLNTEAQKILANIDPDKGPVSDAEKYKKILTLVEEEFLKERQNYLHSTFARFFKSHRKNDFAGNLNNEQTKYRYLFLLSGMLQSQEPYQTPNHPLKTPLTSDIKKLGIAKIVLPLHSVFKKFKSNRPVDASEVQSEIEPKIQSTSTNQSQSPIYDQFQIEKENFKKNLNKLRLNQGYDPVELSEKELFKLYKGGIDVELAKKLLPDLASLSDTNIQHFLAGEFTQMKFRSPQHAEKIGYLNVKYGELKQFIQEKKGVEVTTPRPVYNPRVH